MKKHILIIGGTSGLGLELARQYNALGHHVTVTGRKNPNLAGVDLSALILDKIHLR